MSYISVNVYRSGGSDCSLNGVTATDDNYLVVPVVNGNITEEDIVKRGYVKLIPGEKGGCINFVPESVNGNWSMAGGNFVYTCDSRFSRAYGHAPVSVHDRVES